VLPDGVTLLGVNLSSDKTTISTMTGDWTAHPVLLSLANIHMDIRMKSNSHAFLLVALLPCPKFLTKNRPVKTPGWGYDVLTCRAHSKIELSFERMKTLIKHTAMIRRAILE
jgi:hypothetical protein